MAGFESTETKLNEEIKELKAVIKDLEAKLRDSKSKK